MLTISLVGKVLSTRYFKASNNKPALYSLTVQSGTDKFLCNLKGRNAELLAQTDLNGKLVFITANGISYRQSGKYIVLLVSDLSIINDTSSNTNTNTNTGTVPETF